jgi:hypothetical protein
MVCCIMGGCHSQLHTEKCCFFYRSTSYNLTGAGVRGQPKAVTGSYTPVEVPLLLLTPLLSPPPCGNTLRPRIATLHQAATHVGLRDWVEHLSHRVDQYLNCPCLGTSQHQGPIGSITVGCTSNHSLPECHPTEATGYDQRRPQCIHILQGSDIETLDRQ